MMSPLVKRRRPTALPQAIHEASLGTVGHAVHQGAISLRLPVPTGARPGHGRCMVIERHVSEDVASLLAGNLDERSSSAGAVPPHRRTGGGTPHHL